MFTGVSSAAQCPPRLLIDRCDGHDSDGGSESSRNSDRGTRSGLQPGSAGRTGAARGPFRPLVPGNGSAYGTYHLGACLLRGAAWSNFLLIADESLGATALHQAAARDGLPLEPLRGRPVRCVPTVARGFRA